MLLPAPVTPGITPASASEMAFSFGCVCFSFCVSYKELLIRFRAHPSNLGIPLPFEILNLITGPKTLSPNKFTFIISEG